MKTNKFLLVLFVSIAVASCGGGGGGGGGAAPPPGATVPGAPTIGTASAGNAQISVIFTAPVADGGSAITGYTATCGTVSMNGTASPTVVSGLNNGTAYTCTVTASNAVGTGIASAASNSVTPAAPPPGATVPGAPTIGTASAGNAQISVIFTAPVADGGSAITGYTATCGAVSMNGAASPIVVAGLNNGTAYTCTVTASNAVGTGAASATSNSVTPTNSVTPAASLNDTGITASQCYATSNNTLVECSAAGAIFLSNAQDGMVGRDANTASNSNSDGKLGFSFTAVSGGCVQDNVTGLMWEVKTADGGPRDRLNTYTNYDSASAPQKVNNVVPTQAEIDAATNSIGFKNAVNAANLCGFADWRLPTADELQSIVDYGVANPGTTVDANWFPNTQGGEFWSSSPRANPTQNAFIHAHGWYVGFNGASGVSVGSHERYNGNYVRLVRVGQ